MQDRLEHPVEIAEHIKIPDAQYLVSFALQKSRPPRIVREFLIARMRRAIDFDDELALSAHKVGDIWPNRQLPHELQPK